MTTPAAPTSPLWAAVARHSTDPVPQCDDGSHHTLNLARNVLAERPTSGTCDHCGQMAPCTERRIAEAFVDVMEAALADARSTPAEVLDVDQFREWVIDIVSGYPMKDGKPLGLGGLAFEQCRSRVLHLLDEWQPARSTPAKPLDVERLARAIEIEDDRLPFLDAGIDSTASPRAVAEQIAERYASLRSQESDR